jgi:predicted DNA-binding transcriptional regulator YafY
MTREADDSLIARFRAGGMQEMCWHLFTWGTAVTVVQPGSLRRAILEMTAVIAQHHTR